MRWTQSQSLNRDGNSHCTHNVTYVFYSCSLLGKSSLHQFEMKVGLSYCCSANCSVFLHLRLDTNISSFLVQFQAKKEENWYGNADLLAAHVFMGVRVWRFNWQPQRKMCQLPKICMLIVWYSKTYVSIHFRSTGMTLTTSSTYSIMLQEKWRYWSNELNS